MGGCLSALCCCCDSGECYSYSSIAKFLKILGFIDSCFSDEVPERSCYTRGVELKYDFSESIFRKVL